VDAETTEQINEKAARRKDIADALGLTKIKAGMDNLKKVGESR
jgi:hypothetical protein